MSEIKTYVVDNNGKLTINEQAIKELRELQKQKKEIEQRLTGLSQSIVNELKTHFSETTNVGEYNFVVKGGFYDYEFDLERFKSENLALYISYLIPRKPKESFVLVSATREKKNEQD